MKNAKVRVAVIGCGAIAQHRHLPEYKARKDVEILAVVDINAKRARDVAGHFGVPRHYESYQDVLKLKPDAVSICTPTAYHAPYSVAFLKAGAHVLCEKPMAASMKEARAMVAAAKARGRQCMIGQNQRLHVSHIRGKALLKSGMLGRPLGFSTTFAHGGPEGWSIDGPKCHFFKKGQAIWGSLADLGVHKIDLMRWLLDDDFVEAAAMCDTVQKKNCDVEDIAFCTLRSSKGLLGQMLAAWTYKPLCDNSTVIYCDKGILRLEDDSEFTVIAELASGETHCIKTKGIQTNLPGAQTSSGVIDGFIDAIVSGKPVPIPAQGVLNSLATVIACVQASKTGRTVKVATT